MFFNFFPGDVASFIYDGGSHPGTERTVCVTKSGDTKVFGVDMKLGELRSFSKNKMRDIEILTTDRVIRLNPDALPTSTDIEQLIRDYEKDGCLVYDKTSSLIIIKPKKEKVDETSTKLRIHRNISLWISSPDNYGDTIRISINPDDDTDRQIVSFKDGKQITEYKKSTTENLVSALRDVGIIR